jgi:hypothetical protein
MATLAVNRIVFSKGTMRRFGNVERRTRMPSDIPWVKDEDGDLSYEWAGGKVGIQKNSFYTPVDYSVSVYVGQRCEQDFPTLEAAKDAVPGEIGKVIDALYQLLPLPERLFADSDNVINPIIKQAKIEVLEELVVSGFGDDLHAMIGKNFIEAKIAELEKT